MWLALMTFAACFEGGLWGVTATVHVDPSFTSANVHLRGWSIPEVRGTAAMDPDLVVDAELQTFLSRRGVRLVALERDDDRLVLTVALPVVGRRRILLHEREL